MKYRKKPVVIEAMKFTRDRQKEIVNFTEGKMVSIEIPRTPEGIMTGVIETLEGRLTATENDYIVKGIEGEFYAVKPHIFHETYEKVDEKGSN